MTKLVQLCHDSCLASGNCKMPLEDASQYQRQENRKKESILEYILEI